MSLDVDTVVAGETTSASKFNKLVAAINAIWRGTTAGDLDYYTSDTEKTRLAVGANGYVLGVVSGIPAWIPKVEIAKITRSSNQSIPHATYTYVTFTDEEIDTFDAVDLGASNRRITIPAGFAGYVRVTAYALWDDRGGASTLRIILNGNLLINEFQYDNESAGGKNTNNISTIVAVSENDYFELDVRHVDNDTSLNLTNAYLMVEWLRGA